MGYKLIGKKAFHRSGKLSFYYIWASLDFSEVPFNYLNKKARIAMLGYDGLKNIKTRWGLFEVYFADFKAHSCQNFWNLRTKVALNKNFTVARGSARTTFYFQGFG